MREINKYRIVQGVRKWNKLPNSAPPSLVRVSSGLKTSLRRWKLTSAMDILHSATQFPTIPFLHPHRPSASVRHLRRCLGFTVRFLPTRFFELLKILGFRYIPHFLCPFCAGFFQVEPTVSWSKCKVPQRAPSSRRRRRASLSSLCRRNFATKIFLYIIHRNWHLLVSYIIHMWLKFHGNWI